MGRQSQCGLHYWTPVTSKSFALTAPTAGFWPWCGSTGRLQLGNRLRCSTWSRRLLTRRQYLRFNPRALSHLSAIPVPSPRFCIQTWSLRLRESGSRPPHYRRYGYHPYMNIKKHWHYGIRSHLLAPKSVIGFLGALTIIVVPVYLRDLCQPGDMRVFDTPPVSTRIAETDESGWSGSTRL